MNILYESIKIMGIKNAKLTLFPTLSKKFTIKLRFKCFFV